MTSLSTGILTSLASAAIFVLGAPFAMAQDQSSAPTASVSESTTPSSATPFTPPPSTDGSLPASAPAGQQGSLRPDGFMDVIVVGDDEGRVDDPNAVQTVVIPTVNPATDQAILALLSGPMRISGLSLVMEWPPVTVNPAAKPVPPAP